jgi:DNA-binding NarL/FixJ family response regulator
MNGSTRILIGDDHEHARQAIRLILEREKRFQVVGEAQTGPEVLEATERLNPDLILLDIHMPEMDGLETTRLIKERFPSVKIIIVTVSDDVSDLFEAIKRGAQGYLVKNVTPSLWLDYLRAVALDETPMPREIARRILAEFHPVPKPESEDLTLREREILTLVAEGLSNKEIASMLSISEYTVKNHLKKIMQKLHLKNRVQLTRYALDQGWRPAEPDGPGQTR